MTTGDFGIVFLGVLAVLAAACEPYGAPTPEEQVICDTACIRYGTQWNTARAELRHRYPTAQAPAIVCHCGWTDAHVLTDASAEWAAAALTVVGGKTLRLP